MNPAILTPLGIDTVLELPGVREHLVYQPEITLTWTLNTARSWTIGNNGYVVYPNATDLFGTNTSAVAAELLASLPEHAASIAAINNGAASADAIEPILKIQYDSIFESRISTTEMLSQLYSTGTARRASVVDDNAVLSGYRAHQHCDAANRLQHSRGSCESLLDALF